MEAELEVVLVSGESGRTGPLPLPCGPAGPDSGLVTGSSDAYGIARLAPASPGGLRAEGTFFTTDLENQTIPASQASSLCAGLYAEIRHTWLPVARFPSGIYQGNRLPYAPEYNFGLTGYRQRRGFSIQVDGARVGDQYGDNRRTAAARLTARLGCYPLTGWWNLPAGQESRRERYSIQPFVTIKNLADAAIFRRAVQGIQQGLFRQVQRRGEISVLRAD